MKRRFFSICLIFILLLFPLSVYGNNSSSAEPQNESSIIGITDGTFYLDLKGTYYIYFGRPTCPECLEFEPLLESVLAENQWIVYYYNTTYWKDSTKYDYVLERYQVNEVPLLVKTLDGEYVSDYRYDSSQPEQAKADLEAFFIPKETGIGAVTTESNHPMDFSGKLLGVVFLTMTGNVLYLFFRRKKLGEFKGKGAIGISLLNCSGLLILNYLIGVIGFGFGLQYEAAADDSILAQIGTRTAMFITPALYIVILFLCAWIYDGGRHLRKEKQ